MGRSDDEVSTTTREETSAPESAPSAVRKADVARALIGSAPVASPVKPARLASLDAFRGLTVAAMLLVINAALDEAVPKNLVHAAFGSRPTLADMVFPWFLLAVGVAIPFSATGARERGMTRPQRFLMALRRAVTLYLAGALVDSSIAHEPYAGLGVLQLIALVYFFGRILYGAPVLARGALILLLLGGYGWALTSLPVAGFEPNVFTKEHNLSQYLNDNVFSPYRLEGLLSVIPTTALVLIGTIVGDSLQLPRRRSQGLGYLLLGMAVTLISVGSLWGRLLTMTKTFWTSSYICYAAGWGVFVLALLYLYADVAAFRWPRLRGVLFPLNVFGANALTAYAGAILVKVHVLQEWMVVMGDKRLSLQDALLTTLYSQYGRVQGGWLYMALYLFTVWLGCLYLYRKGIFIRA
jgi:predicted acyltransferase